MQDGALVQPSGQQPQHQLNSCPVSLHTWQHSGPVMWAATLASAQQSICVIADVSGDICIHGSTVAQLCEQQPWHQLNSHSVSLQTCLVTFAYMAAQWPQICEQQPWHQLNSPIVSLQTCLVTFAYMAAQWPSFVGSKGSSSLCSQQAWPQGPRSLWDWLVQWNTCRRFDWCSGVPGTTNQPLCTSSHSVSLCVQTFARCSHAGLLTMSLYVNLCSC